ncbi:MULTISPECIES: flagellar hook-associated protein FlgL [Nitrincola]|uniref:Hook-filament junction protein n=1 Tax=Nitrincola nitratireducens TaxID=1229521 RepID=W9VFR7_9GAMM|nr:MULTISPECIES: flagellar hook-associated protein FlgL [Nitrincola]EXJ09535.1 Hook-filament junction protein [Nitrincola nitratireducens]
MRIATQQQFSNAINNMQRNQQTLSKTQEQISAAKRVLKPSDDPVAAAQIAKLERELAQYDKFKTNIDVTRRRLELEETILTDINVALDRMRELTIQAGNATLSDSDRVTIAKELREMASYSASLMNTKDSQGEYLFSGSKGLTKPYELMPDGRYQFNGDGGQRMIQVSSDLLVPSNDSGELLFEAVGRRLVVNPEGEARDMVASVSFDSKADEDRFRSFSAGLRDLQLSLELTADAPANEYAYRLRDSGGNLIAEVDNLSDGDFPVEIELEGLKIALQQPTPALNLATNPQADVVLNIRSEQKSLIDVALDFAEILERPKTPENAKELEEMTAKTLADFVTAAERNLEVRTALGARQNALDRVESSNEEFTLFTKTTLSSIQDLDYATAITEFKMAEVTLQAAQATFARVQNLSLFDYLR